MSSAPKKTSIRADVVHWLTISAAILSGMSELAAYVDWIPGRYGHLATAFFAVVGVVYLIILKVEKRLASPEELTAAIGDSLKDISPELPKLQQDSQNLIKQAEQFAPKK
jgi:hypothetical protein